MKFKSILLPLLLAIGLIGPTFAGFLDDWPDDALCGWMENPSPPAHIVEEVQKRGIGCEGGKAVVGAAQTNKITSTNKETTTSNRASSSVDKEITIYDVAFSPEVLEKLLKLVVSQTDYDFSKHKLTNNVKDLRCAFKIHRVVYENSELGVIEGWNMAQGGIIIQGSDVSFTEGSSWRVGGLSTDKSYLRDGVNIKLTEDGYIVGKMAYFTHTVNQGEVPREPLYPILTKHKRSKPINLKSIGDSAEFWIDIEDWAGGILRISRCKYL